MYNININVLVLYQYKEDGVLYMNNILSKNTPLFLPTYMQDFFCTGPNCEYNCCNSWEIRIDENTLKKYKSKKNNPLHNLFGENLIKEYFIEDNSIYKIKHKNNKACPFLDVDKLCMIHKHLGEDYLCNSCAIYPRTFNIINQTIEVSGYISCPEIARLVLTKRDGLDFEYSYDFSKYEYLPKRIKAMSNIIDSNNIQYKNSYMKYLWNIRNFCIDIIQNRNMNLDDNLILLGLFLDKVNSSIENNDVDNILHVIEIYSDYIYKIPSLNLSSQDDSLYNLKYSILFQVLSKKANYSNISCTFNKYYSQFLKGINYSDKTKIEEVIEIYNYSYNKYYKPFFSTHNFILENYLVNYIFRTLFPFDHENNVFKQYASLAINYSILKLLLVGIASFHKGLDENMVIEVLQSYAKVYNHDFSFANQVYENLKKYKLDDISHTAVFIMD